MALVLNKRPISEKIGAELHLATCDLALDAAYPSGGYPFDPAVAGITVPEAVIIPQQSGYHFEYDYTNKKIKALVSSTGTVDAEFGGTDLSAITHLRVVILGRPR